MVREKSGGAGKAATRAVRPSAVVDTRVIYCGDNLDQLKKLPDGCVDLVYIDPPFNSNRNYEVFWGETKEKRAFEDRHASTQAYIEFMRPRCVELRRVLGMRSQVPQFQSEMRCLSRMALTYEHRRCSRRREEARIPNVADDLSASSRRRLPLSQCHS